MAARIGLVLTDDRGEQIAVQCKQWRKWDIGVPKVRELVGAMTDAGIRKARLVTLSGYSHPAKELADRHNIEILNQAELIRMLEALSGRSDPKIQARLTDTRTFGPKCQADGDAHNEAGRECWTAGLELLHLSVVQADGTDLDRRKRSRWRLRLGLPLLALAMIAAAWRSIAPQSEKLPPLQMRFAGKCSKPDFGTVAFQLSSPEPCSIFLLSTTVEAPEEDGWKAAATFARKEIVRLKPNVPQEICVEPSGSDPWRLSISYGTEMHGPRLFRVQLREAWILKSFSNWTGRAWGGGRFSGNWTLTSEEVQHVR